MSLVYYVKPEECYKIQKTKQRNKPKTIPLRYWKKISLTAKSSDFFQKSDDFKSYRNLGLFK